MSESRQHFTGKFFSKILFYGVVFAVAWWLPTIFFRMNPEMNIISKEPWLIDPDELNWRRSFINIATKPGFKVITSVLMGMLMVAENVSVKFLKQKGRRQSKWRTLGGKLKETRLRPSMEWVMEGSKSSALLEYARWLRVLN